MPKRLNLYSLWITIHTCWVYSLLCVLVLKHLGMREKLGVKGCECSVCCKSRYCEYICFIGLTAKSSAVLLLENWETLTSSEGDFSHLSWLAEINFLWVCQRAVQPTYYPYNIHIQSTTGAAHLSPSAEGDWVTITLKSLKVLVRQEHPILMIPCTWILDFNRG